LNDTEIAWKKLKGEDDGKGKLLAQASQ